MKQKGISITADEFQYILKRDKKDPWYFPRLEQVIDALFQEDLKEKLKDSETLVELNKRLVKIEKDMDKIVDAYVKKYKLKDFI